MGNCGQRGPPEGAVFCYLEAKRFAQYGCRSPGTLMGRTALRFLIVKSKGEQSLQGCCDSAFWSIQSRPRHLTQSIDFTRCFSVRSARSPGRPMNLDCHSEREKISDGPTENSLGRGMVDCPTGRPSRDARSKSKTDRQESAAEESVLTQNILYILLQTQSRNHYRYPFSFRNLAIREHHGKGPLPMETQVCNMGAEGRPG